MKKQTFTKLLLIFGLLVTMKTYADPVHIVYPMACTQYGHTELAPLQIQSLEYAVSAVKCGKPEVALRYVAQAQKLIVKDLNVVGVTPRGSCYDRRGCTGNILGTSTVEKGTCNAAGGKSWRQQTPTQGACVNI